ncbi:GNAT family N-acetyltransferase [Natronolimnobius baerhuensis]|uniref:N-acetyltransferase domain-containing protein n=1 Tax=Natronolimnobius baerhuensis TaxID=253108 RepID=A0A202E9D6_9EURY|nr:GNAT family N-acetyltransferase [Natronolimnobius baerhuensis]OVE84837.1 hypothetical protein B2G88_10705 [Natronolimnobius baerhuensis]
MVSIRFVDASAREREQAAIRQLLVDADESFVPPLTGANRATVSRSDDEGGSTDIDGYVDRCVSRPLLGAFDGDDLVGFSSFHELTTADALEGYTPATHVEILIVDEGFRNRGIATRLYRALLEENVPASHRHPYVATKTWSTNHAHIAILEELSFECVERLPDDRKPGVDTVYYARHV